MGLPLQKEALASTIFALSLYLASPGRCAGHNLTVGMGVPCPQSSSPALLRPRTHPALSSLPLPPESRWMSRIHTGGDQGASSPGPGGQGLVFLGPTGL